MSNYGARYDRVSSNSRRSRSDASIQSRPTASSGPSSKEPALITSTWGIGWQTPTFMIACYVLATSIAFTHLILFHYLDNKEANGPNEIAPQAYISTASNILANSFGFALRGSLGLAFVQHLWYLLRIMAMKVSTIEELFSVRSNPLMLFKPSALKAAPLLCSLALLMLVSQFITGLPPGALTVVATQKTSYGLVDVPSFDATFMSNGSGVEANKYSFMTLSPYNSAGFTTGGFNNKDGTLLNRLARQVLVAGESFTMPTPCGTNCSYVMEFEGPYMECNTSTSTFTSNTTDSPFNIFTGQWTASPTQSPNPALFYNGTYTLAHFIGSVLTPLNVTGTYNGGGINETALIQNDTSICVPGRARYTVENTYLNGVQSRNISTEPIAKLINLALPTHDSVVIVPGFCAGSGINLGYGTVAANWTNSTLAFYRDNNMMAIFSSLMSWLDGEFEAGVEANFSSSINGTQTSYEPYWKEGVYIQSDGNSVATSLGAQNGTLIDSTRFNSVFDTYSTFETANPSFNLSQDLINEYMFNMTISMMMAYKTTTQTVNATSYTIINVYRFSQPLSLVLPYFITLLASLPFVVVGCLSLFKNGVSAIDGSFIQIIATSTGSATLDRAAAGGCLGGNESVPKELKDLRIRFGEFIGRDEPGRIRRAGFGTEEEVTALTQGDSYGIARWI